MTTPTTTPEMARQILGATEPMRRDKAEPRSTITLQIPFSMDEELEERAHKLGVKKRDLIIAGIKMALESPDFQR